MLHLFDFVRNDYLFRTLFTLLRTEKVYYESYFIKVVSDSSIEHWQVIEKNSRCMAILNEIYYLSDQNFTLLVDDYYEMIVNIKNASGSNIFDRSTLIDVVGSWWGDCDEIRFEVKLFNFIILDYKLFNTLDNSWPVTQRC